MNFIGPEEFKLDNMLGFSNPLPFFPYIFVVYILYLCIEKRKYKNILFYGSAFLWIISYIIDFILRFMGAEIMIYNYESLGRLSIVFESIFLILAFNNIKNEKSLFL